jgi:hypothetical protein
MILCLLQDGTLHLITVDLWKLIIFSPINNYWIALLRDTFTCVHYHQMDENFQAYDLLEILIFNFRYSTLMTITTWCHSLMGYIKSFFACKLIEIHLTPHSNQAKDGNGQGMGRVEQYNTYTHIIYGYKILPVPVPMGIKLYPYPYPAGAHTHWVPNG